MNGPLPPSLAQLSAMRGHTVLLGTPEGTTVPATVQGVGPGIAMNEHYHCYSAEFLLAPDMQLPQAVYALQAGEASWSLLMTPVGLAADRRGRLQAVIHAPQTSAAICPDQDFGHE